jgi:translation initiation factor IF-1
VAGSEQGALGGRLTPRFLSRRRREVSGPSDLLRLCRPAGCLNDLTQDHVVRDDWYEEAREILRSTFPGLRWNETAVRVREPQSVASWREVERSRWVLDTVENAASVQVSNVRYRVTPPVGPPGGLPRGRFVFSKSCKRREMSEKEAGIEVQGKVEESSGGMYRVKIDQGPTVLAYASGKMKRFHIRIIAGDRVKVELSPYDLTRGRITYRDK